MALYLDIVEYLEFGPFSIGWFDDEDEFISGDLRLGEPCMFDEEHQFVSRAVGDLAAPSRRGSNDEFEWDTIDEARKALRIAGRAWADFKKENPKHDWPDWAIKADAEGWKPPEGWRP